MDCLPGGNCGYVLGFVRVEDDDYEVHIHDCSSKGCRAALLVSTPKTHPHDRLKFHDAYNGWEPFANVCIHPLNVILVTMTMVLPR